MVHHCFKIAFRNLLKYKTQSIISIVGLTIGFTCFALANLWIHNEMTYDSAAEGSERMYILYQKNILLMFVKEYMILLSVASLIAFPLGYVLMKQWLQSYVEQTEISLWIYLAIFGFVAIFILCSIGWHVWQAARQNPAEVIKSE